jgi:hypothetical protein
MHELLILNIILKKFESIHKELQDEFTPHLHYFSKNDIFLGQYDTAVDCAVTIAAHFKHLENSDNEGIYFQAHINKSDNSIFEIDLDYFKSNGQFYEDEDSLSLFTINLKEGKVAISNVLKKHF